MVGRGHRIGRAVALGVIVLTSLSPAPGAARPLSAPSTTNVLGGAIVDVREAGGRIYVAFGNRLAVYTDDLSTLVTEVQLDGYPTELAVDGASLAVVLADGAIQLVDLEHLAATKVPADVRAAMGDVTSIVLSAGILASSTATGEIALVDVRNAPAPQLLDVLRLDTVFPGAWWVMDMAAYEGTFYAVLFDSKSTDRHGAVVEIRHGVDGDWRGSPLGEFSGRQSEQIEADGATIAVLTATTIFLFVPTSASTSPTSIAFTEGTRPRSMALANGQLHVLEWNEGSSEQPNMALATYDIGRGDGSLVRTAVPLEADNRTTWHLRACASGVYSFGRDELVAYDMLRSDSAELGRTRSLITVAIGAVEPWIDDRLLATRQDGGVCALDRTSGRAAWCADPELTGLDLIRQGEWLIGTARAGLITARVGRDGMDIVDRVDIDLTRERIVDVVRSGDGLIAVMDTNAPRAPKTRFRIDEIAIQPNGSIVIGTATDIETPDCGKYAVRAAVAGTWLGLTCDRQVLEFVLDQNGPVRVGQMDLPSPGQAIAVDEHETVAVGTATGLVAYDVATREVVGPSPIDAGSGVPVESVEWSGVCILTIQVTSRGARTVWQYCPEANDRLSGRPVYGYANPQMHIEGTALEVLPDSVLVVTGLGTIVQLPVKPMQPSVFLPFTLRFAGR